MQSILFFNSLFFLIFKNIEFLNNILFFYERGS